MDLAEVFEATKHKELLDEISHLRQTIEQLKKELVGFEIKLLEVRHERMQDS